MLVLVLMLLLVLGEVLVLAVVQVQVCHHDDGDGGMVQQHLQAAVWTWARGVASGSCARSLGVGRHRAARATQERFPHLTPGHVPGPVAVPVGQWAAAPMDVGVRATVAVRTVVPREPVQ